LNRINRLAPYFLGLVFITTGILKIIDPGAFAFSVARLRIAPMALVGPIAILLPWIEVVTGVALLITRQQIPALKLAWGLLVLFTAVLGIARLLGTSASCGCFGSSDSFINRPDFALIRNLPLIALAWTSLRGDPTSREGPASPA